MRRAQVALAACLLAAVALVTLPLSPPAAPPASVGGDPPAVPADLVSQVPTRLADGSSYALRYVIDSRRSVGISAAADGSAFRVVEVADGAVVTTLRSLASETGPFFDAFVSDGQRVYWTETTLRGDGTDLTGLWAATIATTAMGPAEPVVDDMGFVYLSGSAYDVIVGDGVISWAVVDGVEVLGVQVRSVPVMGGPVTTSIHEGAWRQTARPWLTVSTTDAAGLLNVQTGERLMFAGTGIERVNCAPAWCRVTLTNGDETLRLELAAPDGSQRRRIAGPGVRFITVDPAALGRYELLSDTNGLSSGEMRLLLFDARTDTTSLVDIGPLALVSVRDRYAWWQSGTATDPVWRVLDLGALAG
jgi:hypothetical protein